MGNRSVTAKCGEDLREHVASIWKDEVVKCSNCWDADVQPKFKPRFQNKGNQCLRWRNRHRVPHIGTEFGKCGPRIVFVGLEDPEDLCGVSSLNPLAEMKLIEETLATKPDDHHRMGEVNLAHDLLGSPANATGGAIFRRVATINSHPCSLVIGTGRQSASGKLLNACDLAWRIIFDELCPDILVLEGKGLVWQEAHTEVNSREWKCDKLESKMPPNKARLFHVQTPAHAFYILALYHPSRSWFTRNSKYYRDVIVPAVSQLRTLGVVPPCG
jgi:hypothetical protein